MFKLSLKTLALLYTSFILLAATVLSPLPYPVLSLVLLSIVISTALRPPPPRFNIIISLAVISLAPLFLESVLGRLTVLTASTLQIMSAILILPAYYRLDSDLKENSRSACLSATKKEERRITAVSVSLLATALTIILIAPIVNRPVLLLSGVSLLLFLLGILIWTWFSVPRHPLAAHTVAKRIIAGTEGSVPLRLTSQAKVALRTHLRFDDPWVKITPAALVIPEGESQFKLDFTPPLAGQSRPGLRATAVDPRGLVRVSHELEPLQLHIIPRAKYAAWLATRYLEQAGSGVISAEKFPRTISRPRRGTEFGESRSYQSGDPLRDIDWKHTLKLSQLIVREYREAGDRAAIIAVNLSVANAEEADKVAFNFITAALTLAKENIPTALAAYNHQHVISSLGIIEPMKMLRQALTLVKEITIVKFAERYLEPVDIARIRRNISQLKQTESEPAQKLLDIFNFESHAIEESARSHPATLALTAAARRVPAPAMILLISQLNHDAEALLVTGEKLSRRMFTTLPVAIA